MCHAEVYCGPPIKLDFTKYLTSGGDTVGGKVMYRCIHGYERRSGSGFSRCPLEGEWTTPNLVCEGWSLDLSSNLVYFYITGKYVVTMFA